MIPCMLQLMQKRVCYEFSIVLIETCSIFHTLKYYLQMTISHTHVRTHHAHTHAHTEHIQGRYVCNYTVTGFTHTSTCTHTHTHTTRTHTQKHTRLHAQHTYMPPPPLLAMSSVGYCRRGRFVWRVAARHPG